MIKKIIASLLIAGMIIQNTVVSLAFTPNDDFKINMAFDMGIFTEDANGDRLLEENVTRINMLIAVYRLMHYDSIDVVPVATKQYYSDISLYHYGAGYAQMMTESGFVKGYTDGTYGVDDDLTLEQCITILLRSAGYTNYFARVNKTPYTVALDLGLLNGINLALEDAVNREIVAKILYNLMFIKCIKPTIAEDDKITFEAGDEYIREVLNLDYVEGLVDGVAGVSLYGEIAKNVVSVNENALYGNFIIDYLGCKGIVIFNPNTDTALSIIPDKKLSRITIDADDIVKYEGNTYYYYKSSSKTAKAIVTPGFDAIYNQYQLFDGDYMVPDYGDVTLIDNDDDGKYDVVIINDYESYILESYSAADEVLVMKNTTTSGERIKLDFNDYADFKLYDSDGKEIEQRALASGQTLTIRKSLKNEFIDITISDTVINGTIKGIEEDNGKKYTIDKLTYKAISKLYSDEEHFVGASVSAYIDSRGRIAGILAQGNNDTWNYGYIKNIFVDTDDEKLYLKVFTSTGRVDKIECDERIYLDGERTDNYPYIVDSVRSVYNNFENDEITTVVSEQATTHLVRYFLNGKGLVSKIDTPIRHSLYDSTIPDNFSDDNCFMIRSKGYIYYKSGMRMFKTVMQSQMDIDGDIYGSESMPIFIIPTDLESSSEDDFSAIKLSSSSFGEIYYYASGYSTVIDSVKCNVMAIRRKGGTSTKKMLLVDKIGRQLDANGELATAISGYVGGAYKTMAIKKNSFSLTSMLHQGDVVFYDYVNEEMEINELGYSLDKTGYLNENTTYHPDDGGIHFNIPYRIIRGTISKVADNKMMMVPEGQATELMPLPSTVIIYDSKDGKVKTGTVYDVRTSSAWGEGADIVLISSRSGNIDEMIAIRK